MLKICTSCKIPQDKIYYRKHEGRKLYKICELCRLKINNNCLMCKKYVGHKNELYCGDCCPFNS